ncbi:MAG TPA: GntR family transcriptional regulator [Pseudonocardiaceae bacterium]|nr:GntR family transcriptional regulator [Pseudonocardiaceae bacterium]
MKPSRTTLAEHVRDELVACLVDGEFPMGSKLPNEQELGDRFGVSRATVREAVRGLLEAGYLDRRHGSGTYVIGTPRQHTLDTNLSYLDMITAAGMTPGLTVLSTEVRGPDQDETRRLRLADDDRLLVVERIRTADGRPVVYSRDRIPCELLSPVGPAGSAGVCEPSDIVLDASLYRLLASVGAGVRSAAATLLPVLADDQLAHRLGVPVGTPLQYIDQTDYDDTGRPVMVSSEWHVPDVLPLRLNRRAAAVRSNLGWR